MSLLKVGSQGDDVKSWQEFLNAQGFSAGTADGIFGPNTEAATKSFQMTHSLVADGIVGPNTIAKATELGYDSGQPASDGSSPIDSPFPGGSNVVIDVSHHNGPNLNFAQAKAAGIVGVIHKATQGTGFVDPMYETNKQKALDAGLLWGAYHFGNGSDPTAQANHFLNTVNADDQTLLVLDFEPNPSGVTMSLAQSQTFVTVVEQASGRYPGFYTGSLFKELVGNGKDELIGKCWLWLSQYGPRAVVPPTWESFTMWQYSDGTYGPEPHEVPGIGKCDRDVFNGTVDELKALWVKS